MNKYITSFLISCTLCFSLNGYGNGAKQNSTISSLSKTIIIGVSGPSASGKTSIAKAISDNFGSEQVVVISEDSYYKDNSHLPMEKRNEINFDHPHSMEHTLLIKHLKMLKQGSSVQVPSYDYSEHKRSKNTRLVSPSKIIVLEGILLFFDPNLRDLMDIRVYMDTPLDICLGRRITRDINERNRTLSSVLKQYEKTVRPMCLKFIVPSKQHAHIIVPDGGENKIAIDLIRSKIREIVSSNSK